MSATPPDSEPAQKPKPNYAARRMLVSTVLITVFVVGAVMVYRLLTGGDANLLADNDPEWDHIMMVDVTSGKTVTVDDEGENPATGDVNIGRVLDLETDGVRVVARTRTELRLIGPDYSDSDSDDTNRATTTEAPTSTTAAVVDDSDPLVATIPSGSTVTRLPVDGLKFAIYDTGGGNITIVDAVERTTIDIGARMGQGNPRLFIDALRYNPSGTRFAVAETTTFQTVVVGFDDSEPPTYLPDIPVAVGDTLVATTQTVGNRAELSIFDDAGERVASASSDVVSAGAIDDDRLVATTETGTLIALEPSGDQVVEIASLGSPADDPPNRITPVGDGRLIIVGDRFAAIVNKDGTAEYDSTFSSPTPTTAVEAGWECLPVGYPDRVEALVAIDNGTQLATGIGFDDAVVSDDGCTLVGTTDAGFGYLSVDPDSDDRSPISDEFTELDQLWLSPDGNSLITVAADGTTALLTRRDDDSDGERFESTRDLTEDAPTTFEPLFIE